MKELLRDELNFRLNGRLWLEGSERFMGIGRLELLTHIRLGLNFKGGPGNEHVI